MVKTEKNYLHECISSMIQKAAGRYKQCVGRFHTSSPYCLNPLQYEYLEKKGARFYNLQRVLRTTNLEEKY